MKLDTVVATPLEIPLRETFTHASASRSTSRTLWVKARAASGATGHGEACPRTYVTGEDLDDAQAFVARHAAAWRRAIGDAAAVLDWGRRQRAVVDAQPAAWAGVELALLDLCGRVSGRSVEALLGLPELRGRFRYTAVLGDSAPERFAARLAHYRQAGFDHFKIKLSGDLARDRAKIAALVEAGVAPGQVRADANNFWRAPAAAIRHFAALDWPFAAVEEALQPGDRTGLGVLADWFAAHGGTRIVLDESVSRAAQLAAYAARPERWLVNLRVSKMGGLARSLEVLARARELGLRLIVGAHVGETSLLTRAGLCVAAAAGDLLVAQEGAFGTHLLARDVTGSPLMFGPGGVLDVVRAGLEPAGLGLRVPPVTAMTALSDRTTS